MVFLRNFFKQLRIFGRLPIFRVECIFIPKICSPKLDFLIDDDLIEYFLLESVYAKKALSSKDFAFSILPAGCYKKALEDSNNFACCLFQLVIIGTVSFLFMPKPC